MRIIDQLVYKIIGDNKEFDKSIDSSDAKVNKFGSTAQKIFAGVTVTAVAMTIKKMADLTIQSAALLDRVDKMSQKIGLSREAFQEWDYILSQNGASVDGLQMGLKTLSTAVDQANQGAKEYTEMFSRLNVSVTDANGNLKDQELIFNEVFSALANMENATERTALATRLLGRSATELAPALNVGAQEIEKLRNQAHELGLVYEDDLIDKGVILGDNIDALKAAFTAWRTNALSPILGVMVSVTDRMLGQKSASDRLDEALNDLKTTNDEYNKILGESEGKTDALTQAMVSQAKAARDLALTKLSEAYRESQKDLDSNTKAVEKAEHWIAKYDESLGDLAKKTGYTADALSRMTEEERLFAFAGKLSADEIDRYDVQLGARIKYSEILIEKQAEVNKALSDETAFVVALAQAHLDGNEAVTLFLGAYPELKEKVDAATESIIKEQEAIEERNRAAEDARERNKETIDSYTNLSSVNKRIEEYSKLVKESADNIYLQAYYQEILNMFNERANAIKAEQIKKMTDESEKQKAQLELLESIKKQLADTEKIEKALGDQYDQNAEKISILTSGIKALIEAGVDPETEAIKKLIRQLDALTKGTKDADDATEDFVDNSIEEFNKMTETRAKAYETLNSFYTSDYDKFVKNIQKQAEEFRKAKVDEKDITKWVSDQIQKYDDKVAENAKQKAAEARDAWIAYGFQVVNYLASTFGNINKIQENNNEKELQRLQALVDATEEGTTARADAERALLDKKNDFARQEAERQKKLATFEALLGAAQAIIQVWTDKTLPTWAKIVLSGTAGAATATQLAAIQSTPVPSFDVGSIRIPEDTQAIVHKDEMILPAPIAQQARQEGVSITPAGGGTPAILMIYLDGKKIAESDVQYINSGQVGKISARIVK